MPATLTASFSVSVDYFGNSAFRNVRGLEDVEDLDTLKAGDGSKVEAGERLDVRAGDRSGAVVQTCLTDPGRLPNADPRKKRSDRRAGRASTRGALAFPEARTIRCAIYTRKSSEEGLEQKFNSLDAQREACEAYIASQRPEGWVLVPTSTTTAAFPAPHGPPGVAAPAGRHRGRAGSTCRRLQGRPAHPVARRLRQDGRVLRRAGVSFVSVTQAFNTTTSMGRLTLNVLLSFAQFEREVIGERIRDKIAASKRKGMWMGGPPSLGYDLKDRSWSSTRPRRKRCAISFAAVSCLVRCASSRRTRRPRDCQQGARQCRR